MTSEVIKLVNKGLKKKKQASLTPKPMFLTTNLFLLLKSKLTCALDAVSHKKKVTFSHIFTLMQGFAEDSMG